MPTTDELESLYKERVGSRNMAMDTRGDSTPRAERAQWAQWVRIWGVGAKKFSPTDNAPTVCETLPEYKTEAWMI